MHDLAVFEMNLHQRPADLRSDLNTINRRELTEKAESAGDVALKWHTDCDRWRRRRDDCCRIGRLQVVRRCYYCDDDGQHNSLAHPTRAFRISLAYRNTSVRVSRV